MDNIYKDILNLNNFIYYGFKENNQITQIRLNKQHKLSYHCGLSFAKKTTMKLFC